MRFRKEAKRKLVVLTIVVRHDRLSRQLQLIYMLSHTAGEKLILLLKECSGASDVAFRPL
jgi:hypothetical protein